MTLVRKLVFMLGLLFVSATLTYAQAVVTGTPPFGTFGGGPADSINLANLNVHLTIPVMSKPGRGIPFGYNITYDNSIWTPYNSGSSIWSPAGAFGWTFPGAGQEKVAWAYAGYGIWDATVTYIDSLGTPHFFPGYILAVPNCTWYQNPQAMDGSGYTVSVVYSTCNVVVTARNGETVAETVSPYGSGTPIATDHNGNQISLNTSGVFTDTLGTTALTAAGAAPSNTTFSYTPPGGGSPVSYTMKYAPYTVKTYFQCSGIAEYGPTAQNLVSEIDLPDIGTNPLDKYTFAYESTPGYSGDVTGRLKSVTLPTGGTIYYTYSGGNNGIVCADGSTATLTRQTPDGTWTYAHSESGTAWTTTQTDPQSNVTTMNFQGIYLTQSSNPLETTFTCYNGATVPCISSAITPPVTQQEARAQWPTGLENKVKTTYNSNGLVTEVDEYDYGQGAPPAAPIRKTITSYASLGNGIVGLPSQVAVYDGSSSLKAETNYTYDGATLVSSGITTQHVSVTGSRGNPTTISSLIGGSTFVNQNFTYFDTGMVNVAKDGKNNSTTYAYSSTYQGGYPTTITNALNQITTVAYDINSGLVTSSIDANNQTTTNTYDSLFRPLSTNYPDGGQTSFGYSTQYGGTYAQITEKMDASHNRVSYIWSDGLGREARVAVTNGESQPYDETLNTCFNSMGLVSLQGYPFQDGGWNNPISCSVAGDSYTDALGHPAYDALGRPTRIKHADGSYGSISYTANCATATDEQGKQRTVCTDGLGRITSVVENPGGLNYSTTYSYDVLNNLTTVTQGAEIRTFAHDGLSRLTSAANPESGTTQYTYDAASNVATRLDARNITTTYSYDALNRLTSKTYSDGTPTAYFYYDLTAPWGWTTLNTKGRLSTEQNSQGGSAFSYDAMGRVIHRGQCGPLTCGSSGYDVLVTYNLIGGPISINEAQQAVTLSQLFNTAGLPTQITSSLVDSQHPATLVSGVHYNGAGGSTSYLLGNNLTETAAYNGLVQPCRMNVNSSGTLLSACTASVPSGNLLDLTTGFNYGTGDNGNVMSWAAVGQQTFNRSYTYDGVNRLYTMSAPGSTCSGLSWSYDQWGNRTAQTATGGTCSSPQFTFNTSNHAINPGFLYDAAGNLVNDGVHSYTYDAENRITKIDAGATASYAYDAVGNRVEKAVGGAKTDYIYDAANRVMMEVNQSLAWQAGYVYLGSQLLAEYESGTTYFVHGDHLGSTRLLTNVSGGVVDSMDYLPFGEQIAGASATTHKFTGQERESEVTLDNFQARYYTFIMGRFISPDPIGNFVADPTNPQSWNMYAYVNNNPLAFVDPTGTDPGACEWSNAAGCIADNNLGDFGNWEDFSGAGFGTSYTMDGVGVPAGVATGALDSGAAVECPNDACSGFGMDSNGNTAWVQFYAFEGGVSGYFNPADLANGINEVNGHLMNDANYGLYLQQTYAAQIAAQLNRLNGNLAVDFPGQGISANPNNPNINGGHANFGLVCPGSCPAPGRYDNGVHIPEAGIGHNDTVSPWTGPFSFAAFFTASFWEHGFVDLISGQFVPVFSH